MRRVLPLSLSFLFLMVGLQAQRSWPLGALGAEADFPPSGDSLVIVSVVPDSRAANAGLMKGDVILRLGDVPVGARERERGVPADYAGLVATGLALDAAEGRDGTLQLSVVRGAQTKNLTATLDPVGSFSPTFPYHCPKSDLLRKRSCERIVALIDPQFLAARRDDINRRHTYALAGLALLSMPGKSHDATLTQIRDYLVAADQQAYIPDDFLKPNGLDNWAVVTSAIFLAEYRLRFADATLDPVIARHHDALLARVRTSGVQGHSADVPDNDWDNDYGGAGLNIISTQMHWALAYGKKLGLKRARVPFDRSLTHLLESVNRTEGFDRGAVAYVRGSHSGWDSAGRTSAFLTALKMENREPTVRRELADYLVRAVWRTLDVHANSVYGPSYVPGALNAEHPLHYRSFMDAWRWYLALSRGPSGYAQYVGGRKNVGGDGYMGFDLCAQIMVTLSLAPATGRIAAFGRTETTPHRAPRCVLLDPTPREDGLTLRIRVDQGQEVITCVRYLADGLVIAESTKAPFEATWSQPAGGTFTLTAEALYGEKQRGLAGSVNGVSYHVDIRPDPATTWIRRDIGTVEFPGKIACPSPDALTLEASGADIAYGSDSFLFASRPLDGDGTLTTRLSALGNSAAYARTGLMIRSTLTAGSPYVAVLTTPGAGHALQVREVNHGQTRTAGTGAGRAPVWLRLQRAGNLFVGWTSTNGKDWAELGRAELALPRRVFLGMAACSHQAGKTNTATFSDIAWK